MNTATFTNPKMTGLILLKDNSFRLATLQRKTSRIPKRLKRHIKSDYRFELLIENCYNPTLQNTNNRRNRRARANAQ